MTFGTRSVFRISVEKVHSNPKRITGTLREDRCTFMIQKGKSVPLQARGAQRVPGS